MGSWDVALRSRFGLETFHPWQREAVDGLLEGTGRVLVVAPTGGGKSLCYQFPATELTGTTVVISPLIALMEDQVRALQARDIAATWLSSTVEAAEVRRREEALSRGEYQLVYVSPERLAVGFLRDRIGRLRPPLVAIDEAHCIAQWGHDFRPDYRRLKRVLADLKPPRILACTATATPVVREEILRELGLESTQTHVILRGFARPNLHLAARELDRMPDRRTAALDALHESIGPGNETRGAAIVYAGTRKLTDRVAVELGSAGYRVAAYHAGLDARTRAEVNGRFASKQVDVVVATNAFGMGIDRPDIRAVIHVQAPSSIEAYYQEVGRAGRDGAPAYGLLLTGSTDFGLRRRLIDRSDAGPEMIKRKWSLFLDLMRYAEAGSCRHDFILRYFGDEQEILGGCGHCDVCERLAHDQGADDVTDGPVTIRKALSGIARTRGRAGLSLVADMLVGKRSARLDRLGLRELSTFGLLGQYPRDWVLSLLRRLLTAELVVLSADEFPVPQLSTRGVEVMKGKTSPRVLLPPPATPRRKKRTKASTAAASANADQAVDSDLLEQLRDARLQAAREQGVPAFVVFHDRTLLEIAARRPRTRDELREVSGIGPTKLDRYGDRILKVTAGFANASA